jgi:DnaA family protein
MPLQLPLSLELNPDQGFEQYYAGANVEAVQMLRRAASGAGENPIFLWSEPGLGKSHLLNACCRNAYQLERRACYLPMRAVSRYGPEALEELAHLQLVCVDDIETVAGDADWERALFDFFNQMLDYHHRMIIAARAPPRELGIRLADLETRLAWGLTVKLQPLDDAGKLAALALRADNLGFELTPRVGRFLLSHYPRDLPSLWRLLERIDRATLVAKRRLTIPFLKTYLEETP